jgi:single-strand DNA-binding protein
MEITIITGNVGQDPEMRYTPQGQPVTSFSVAVNRKWTDGNGEQRKETKWFRVAAWNHLAEICNQYVKKGSKILVHGRLNCDPKTGGPKLFTRQDGTAGASFELTAVSVEFLSDGRDTGAGQSAPHDYGGGPSEDDIPF